MKPNLLREPSGADGDVRSLIQRASRSPVPPILQVLVVRRRFFTQVARRRTASVSLQLPAQRAKLLLQLLDLLLLEKHRAVQLFQQVFGETQLDFDLR
jgi:hypothetical protein